MRVMGRPLVQQSPLQRPAAGGRPGVSHPHHRQASVRGGRPDNILAHERMGDPVPRMFVVDSATIHPAAAGAWLVEGNSGHGRVVTVAADYESGRRPGGLSLPVAW